jgi:sugar lactone lactonase YvrE
VKFALARSSAVYITLTNEPPDGDLDFCHPTGARITAFDIAIDGSLSGRRVFAQLESGAHPDGICLDGEGAVWIGCDRACIRVRDGGEVTDSIQMGDGRTAVACMLGGLERRTLFILATSFTLQVLASLHDAESDAHSPARGRIEAMEVIVPGAGLP